MKIETNEQLFEHLNKREIQNLLDVNLRPFRELMSMYKCAMMEIETKLNVLNEEFSLDHDRNPIESIKSRLKSPAGIMEKAARLNVAYNVESLEENIEDIAGVRVIASFVEEIYLIADYILQQDDIRLITKKDYIKNPKENGYRSLHLIVEVPIFLHNEKRWMKVEIQLRTIAMDFWASLDHKVHYKKDIPYEIEQEIIQDLKECAQASADLDKKMENIKNRIYSY